MNATLARRWSADVQEIGDRLVTLNPRQAEELGHYLRDRHGVGPPALALPGRETKVEPLACIPADPVWDVVLEGLIDPGVRVSVMKALRQTGSLSLQQARQALDSLPFTLARGLAQEEAGATAKTLTDAGGRVTLRERRDL
jgi:large subunit ribosomal protein L7/L12